MRYILDERYCLRGWHKTPTGIFDTYRRSATFFPKEQYILLLRCDGAHDINEEELSDTDRKFLERMKEQDVIHEAGPMDYITEEQQYKKYPAGYKQQAHWSITGGCNFKCRHCFMSAPAAKHGAPTKEQLINIADQLKECGIFTVGITGGEPLIREDFFELLEALSERDIQIATLYTNGWLVNEALLDKLDELRMHPAFQLSFDGVGWHDFLRGVPGAEEKTVRTLKLLRDRKYELSVSMCIHRESRKSLRETVKFMASLGVGSMKCGRMMELGDWADDEVKDLRMTREEELEMFEEYIPQYFEDDAPVTIMLGDAFIYSPGESSWHIYDVRKITPEEEKFAPSCGVLIRNFYIGADGMVAPCMGMCDCGYSVNFPNLFETPLREILSESELTRLCSASVGDVRDHNPKCRECEFVDRCTGGCRNEVLTKSDDYYGIDPDVCYFFENGWEERITRAAEEPFREYLKRNPPKEDMSKTFSDNGSEPSQEEDPYI